LNSLFRSKITIYLIEKGSVSIFRVHRYISTAEIVQERITIAKEVLESDEDGEKIGLSRDEVAFYNGLEVNDSAVQVMGDEQLIVIAREIADKVRRNAIIDWTIRESVRAKLMVLVKRTLTKYGYPPDKQAKAV